MVSMCSAMSICNIRIPIINKENTLNSDIAYFFLSKEAFPDDNVDSEILTYEENKTICCSHKVYCNYEEHDPNTFGDLVLTECLE